VNIYHVFGGNKEAAGPVMTVTRWMTTGLSVVSVIALSWLATRIGKRNAFLVSLSFLAFAPISSWWVFTPEQPWLQLVFAVLVAPSMGVAVLANAMVADLVDLDELRTDRRREGMYFAFIAFLQKAAFSFSTLWVGYCLRWVGFNEDLDVQRAETIYNLRLLFALLPLAFIVMSFILLVFYPLNEQRVREIRDVLEARRRERLREGATTS
jgi:GPH family glycoside/pentoside/hexuronide:cation symporter